MPGMIFTIDQKCDPGMPRIDDSKKTLQSRYAKLISKLQEPHSKTPKVSRGEAAFFVDNRSDLKFETVLPSHRYTKPNLTENAGVKLFEEDYLYAQRCK